MCFAGTGSCTGKDAAATTGDILGLLSGVQAAANGGQAAGATRSPVFMWLYSGNLRNILINTRGLGSSVSIATDYGLGGPGSNPGGDEIFRPSRPALGPTQRPIR